MNGRELTAEDVVFNYHRLTGTGSGFSKPEGISSTIVSLDFESISASDEYTVVVKLTKPRIDALWWLVEDNFAWIGPPEVIKQHGDHSDWRNLVGTGPFELTDWVEGSSLTWSKNPDYWGTDEKYPQNRLPYIDTLRALVMKDEASRLAALRSGKVDYIGANAASNINTPDAVESIERTNPDLKIWPYYFRSNAGMTYNLTNPPYSDIRVRKALQMALDLDTVNDTYYKGLAVVTPQGAMGNFLTQLPSITTSGPRKSKRAIGTTQRRRRGSWMRPDIRVVKMAFGLPRPWMAFRAASIPITSKSSEITGARSASNRSFSSTNQPPGARALTGTNLKG